MSFEGFRIMMGSCKSCPKELDPWIKQFCNQPQNSWFVQIDPDWVADWFNQYGIDDMFTDFDMAIELITDRHSDNWDSFTEQKISLIHQQALRIYGMLHARWITQPRGMNLMKEKYEKGVFGTCPRYSCKGAKVIPMGQTLAVRRHSAKIFCPKCRDIYRPTEVVLDGAYFGPAFPHIFLSEYSQYDKRKEFEPYQMKAFGFKIHQGVGAKPKPHDKNKYEDERPDSE